MYNYFKHQNLLKQIEEENEKDKHLKHYNNKKEKMLKPMIENHENRVKQFVYKMANKNYSVSNKGKFINNPKEEYLNENSHKILANKGFLFSKHETEKERIKKLQLEQEEIQRYYEKNIKEKEKNKSMEAKEKIKNKPLGVSFLSLIDKNVKNNALRNRKLRKLSGVFHADPESKKKSNMKFNHTFHLEKDSNQRPELIEPSEDLSYLMFTHLKRKALLEQNGVFGKTLEQEDPYLNYEKSLKDIAKQLKQRSFKPSNLQIKLPKMHFKSATNIAMNNTFYNNDIIKKLKEQYDSELKKDIKPITSGLLGGAINDKSKPISQDYYKIYVNHREKIRNDDRKIVDNYKKRIRNVESKVFKDKNSEDLVNEEQNSEAKITQINKTFNKNNKDYYNYYFKSMSNNFNKSGIYKDDALSVNKDKENLLNCSISSSSDRHQILSSVDKRRNIKVRSLLILLIMYYYLYLKL